VALVDHVDQPRTQQIILFLSARAVLHGRDQIAGFRRKSYKTLRVVARKTTTFQRKINGMRVVQGELVSPAAFEATLGADMAVWTSSSVGN
jgi:hypothetical protein